MYALVVWLENGIEVEGVIPISWVDFIENVIYWPPGVDAKPYIEKLSTPLITSWRSFPLKKVKHKSEQKSECDDYTFTTTQETDSEEKDLKRKPKKKSFQDYVTGSETSDACATGGTKTGDSEHEKSNSDTSVACATGVTYTGGSEYKKSGTLPIPPNKKKSTSQAVISPGTNLASKSQLSGLSQTKTSTSQSLTKYSKSSNSGQSQTKTASSKSMTKNRQGSISGQSQTKIAPSKSQSKTTLSQSKSKSTPSQPQANKSSSGSLTGQNKTKTIYRSRSRSSSMSSLPLRSRSQSRSRSRSSSLGQINMSPFMCSTMLEDKSCRSRSRSKSNESRSRSKSKTYRHNRSHRSRSKSYRSRSRTNESSSQSKNKEYRKYRSRSKSYRSRSRSRSNESYARSIDRSNRSSRKSFDRSDRSVVPPDNSTRKSSTYKTEDKFPMPEARFQRRVLFKLCELSAEIQSLKRIKSVRQVGTVEEKDFFQADSIDEFNLLDERIKGPEERQKMVYHLSLIGGANTKQAVQNILERLMSNRLMSKFNSKGVKGKLSFESSETFKVVIASAMKGNNDITEHQVKEVISYHLKYAPYRKGGGKRYLDNNP
ncbi:pre-mRNA-splicing factor CWC22 homolog [Dreissena polymorpha]|uniref:pre-mRNA-splicing factor CWC22 homolog n=1 Tax=Dreissena polymorpha TaxID=45954 RepID=UPI002264476F|nr:pre-mRNA-splicing factor CWC22 homolog [Dreissena polymorpha]